MTSILFVLSLAFAFFGGGAIAETQRNFDGYKVIRASVENLEQLTFLSKLRYETTFDFWSGPHLGQFADIMTSPKESRVLENILDENNIKFTIWIDNVQTLVLAERESLAQVKVDGGDMNWDDYQQLDTIYAWLDDLQENYSDRVEILNIGKTTENRDMRVIKISNGENSNKPAVYIDGTIHAREWIATSTVTYAINQLVNNASAYAELLDAVDFYVLPVVNPDGYEYSHTTDRLWRKTRSTPEGISCVGADCNRNFDFHWGGEGSSSDPCSTSFRGVAPFSEPEAVNLKNFILKTNANWQAFITVHSYGQLWLTPWGYTEELPEDYEEMLRVADKAVAAVKSFHGTEYTTGTSANVLYKSAGTSRDWGKGVGGVKYVYTVELRDKGYYGFVLPPNQIKDTGEETFAGFLVVAEEVAAKFK